MLLEEMPREALKSIAFSYHYGQFVSQEAAEDTLAYKAAVVLAKREGRTVPQANLFSREDS